MFQDALKIKHPFKRLRAVYKLCDGTKICSGGEKMDESAMNNISNELDMAGAGEASTGCGAAQPKFRREGIKIHLECSESDEIDAGEGDRGIGVYS